MTHSYIYLRKEKCIITMGLVNLVQIQKKYLVAVRERVDAAGPTLSVLSLLSLLVYWPFLFLFFERTAAAELPESFFRLLNKMFPERHTCVGA
jgi:hypothetical protein